MNTSLTLSLIELAIATGGSTTGGDVRFTDVTTDSRKVAPGQLFVALRGDNFDGHDFVKDVIARGAAAALVNRDWAANWLTNSMAASL